jgi:hypothetical protein
MTPIMATKIIKVWLAWLDDHSDSFLTVAELFVVLALAASVTILALLTLTWIFLAGNLTSINERLTGTLNTLSNDWKAVLLLLVPLFYRTARRFIARIRKGPLGMEADPEEGEIKPNATAAETNPPEGAQT